jgi:L-cysteine:1D-myo-inositol 2-amino-2-deoxy-alpha-D-glucopyranoside ligase
MRLYNVLTGRLEEYRPSGQSSTVYVCGITPYDTTHLGHCFTYSTFDVLIRYLGFKGDQARYVQNVTDIDDDILRKAGEVGQDWRELGDQWTRHFIDDSEELNMRPPDYFPRATEVINEIQAAVEDLLEAGVAYECRGNVYFEVARDPGYGRLSRLNMEEMLPIANERGNRPDDPNKRHPLDFVLWQAHAPGEPAWDSPWGPGRPGWHIECSTMAAKYLGQPVDIHGGGADLVFPHHESEIAQAEKASGQAPFARFWLHTAMLRYEGEKMSKSLGNLVLCRDLLNGGWRPDALRLLMAGHHYREPWTYHEEDLAHAAQLAETLKEAVAARGGAGPALKAGGAQSAFEKAMEDDLGTPAARQILAELAEAILAGARRGDDVADAQRFLRDAGSVLGLRLDHSGPEESVTSGWKRHRSRFETKP